MGSGEGLGRPPFCFGWRLRRRQNTWPPRPAPCFSGRASSGAVVVWAVLGALRKGAVLDVTLVLFYTLFQATLIWFLELDGVERNLENY